MLVEVAATTQTVINWEAVIAIASSVATLVSLVLVPTLRSLRHSIDESVKTSVEDVIQERVTPVLNQLQSDVTALRDADSKLDKRVAHLEGVNEGKRTQLDQMQMTHADPEPGSGSPDPL